MMLPILATKWHVFSAFNPVYRAILYNGRTDLRATRIDIRGVPNKVVDDMAVKHFRDVAIYLTSRSAADICSGCSSGNRPELPTTACLSNKIASADESLGPFLSSKSWKSLPDSWDDAWDDKSPVSRRAPSWCPSIREGWARWYAEKKDEDDAVVSRSCDER